MYGKEESKQIKQEFWTALGMVMKPHLSSEGYKINWINYNTGVKDIFFKTDVSSSEVSLKILVTHNDNGIREVFWDQFLELKTLFHAIMNEEWEWKQLKYDDYGKPYSLITKSTKGNVFDKNQWQNMLAFLKTNILAFDEFWSDAKEIFINLSK